VVAQTPDGALTQHLALGVGHALGVDVLDEFGPGKLEFGGAASRGFAGTKVLPSL
jgi:hypothetical protein